MKDEEGPRTPLELVQRIRTRIPELFRGLERFDFREWRLQGGELLPKEGCSEDPLDADIHFFLSIQRGWLTGVAGTLSRYPGPCLTISPLLCAWDERLREMLEETRSGES